MTNNRRESINSATFVCLCFMLGGAISLAFMLMFGNFFRSFGIWLILLVGGLAICGTIGLSLLSLIEDC